MVPVSLMVKLRFIRHGRAGSKRALLAAINAIAVKKPPPRPNCDALAWKFQRVGSMIPTVAFCSLALPWRGFFSGRVARQHRQHCSDI
jgi:hypothetical protein